MPLFLKEIEGFPKKTLEKVSKSTQNFFYQAKTFKKVVESKILGLLCLVLDQIVKEFDNVSTNKTF